MIFIISLGTTQVWLVDQQMQTPTCQTRFLLHAFFSMTPHVNLWLVSAWCLELSSRLGSNESTKILCKNKVMFERWKQDKRKQSIMILSGIKIYVKHHRKQLKIVLHYVQLTNPLSFQTRFPKSGTTYRKQVVHPRHQTPQGQSVAKPGTPL